MKKAQAESQVVMKDAIDFYWKFKKRVRTSTNVMDKIQEFRGHVNSAVVLLSNFVGRDLELGLEVEKVLECKQNLSTLDVQNAPTNGFNPV